jgi:hypothetical protein
MKRGYSGRHYLTFEREDLHRTYPSTDAWRDYVWSTVETMGAGDRRMACRVLADPSLWQLALKAPAGSGDSGRSDPRRICSVMFDEAPEEAFLAEINQGKLITTADGLSAIGADLPIHVTDYWNPAESIDPIFATRRLANQLMGITEGEKEPGSGANVVIVDQGLNQNYIAHLGGDFVGGWHLAEQPRPGKYGLGHGSMLARNVLKVSPDAAIYDLPVIPEDINDVPKFLSTVHGAFDQIVESIHHLQNSDDERWRRPWVFVNAWATFNRGGEQPEGDYTRRLEHKFNRLVTQMAEEFDMVFAAGNCGQFCPSARCGRDDVGPGHSIIGANSHPDVLTVGAVRADGMWLGYSSQGPGALSTDKPDICAASQFREDDDAAAVNTGTSAACAVAAGVVAALRSQCGMKHPPAALKQILLDTATAKPTGGKWDNQIGHGIINAAAASKACQ